MIQFRKTFNKINAWQIRIIALASLVVLVGSSSQFLANAFASGVGPEVPVQQQVVPVITQAPLIVTHHKTHVIIRRAGIDTLGGYTIRHKR